LDINVPLADEAKSNSLAAATNELDRLFSKDDFGEMEVLDIYILILVLLFVKVPCYLIQCS
jgi:DNA mismatch repair protein PMS2